MKYTVLLLILVAACTDQTSDYPTLLPTAQVLAPPSIPRHAADMATQPDQAAAALHDAGSGLEGKAKALGQGSVDTSDLAARARRLQERARKLQDT